MQQSCPYYPYVKYYICEVDSITNFQDSCQEVINAATHGPYQLNYDIIFKRSIRLLSDYFYIINLCEIFVGLEFSN